MTGSETAAAPGMLRRMAGPVALEHGALLEALIGIVTNVGWCARLREMRASPAPLALHVAVMREPYMTLLLEGRKTVESRFSVNRVSPFGEVKAGDVLALKAQSGPLLGLALVEHAAFYELDAATLADIRIRFGTRLCADGEFWDSRAGARYGSLLRVTEPVAIPPLALAKRDRRGWVRLGPRSLQLAFPA